MIDFLINNDVISGVLKIEDNSTSLSGITQGIIRVVKLGFEQSLTASTTPTLVDFRNPSLNTIIAIPSKVDEVLDVEYILLKPITGATYANGNNLITKTGIFAETQDVRYVYSGKRLYLIDKNTSTPNALYLTEIMQGADTQLFAAYYVKKCVASLYDIPKLVKTLVLAQADCQCKTCGKSIEKMTTALRYIEAVKLAEADCEQKRAFMKCLKELFDLC